VDEDVEVEVERRCGFDATVPHLPGWILEHHKLPFLRWWPGLACQGGEGTKDMDDARAKSPKR
jgi:hypothetical protein